MEKAAFSASVRAIVEFALLSGDLLPGSSLARMREGTLSHQARQRSVLDARAEIPVRGQVESGGVTLNINGRVDLLYERDGITVVEEIKLCPAEGAPQAATPVHRAQAVCYGHLLELPQAIIRVLYVNRDGSEAAAFDELLSTDEMRARFDAYVAPYFAMISEKARWAALRDESIRALPFPFDGYRQGQREMAVQVYWAVKTKKRLFLQAPTGTGKTAAAMYPALKALGEGLTGQIFYLTARTTAQQSATAALHPMRHQGLRLRALTLTAREKICERLSSGEHARCDVRDCPGAIGFFDRLPDALADIRQLDEWPREAVCEAAARHTLCPFELGLCLAEEADLILCDYNYAFDPAVRLRRIFQWTTNVTLLVDEAHNLPERTRGMLSAEMDAAQLKDIRRDIGKAMGRKAPLYKALTALTAAIEALPDGVSKEKPEGLLAPLSDVMDQIIIAPPALPLSDLPRTVIAAMSALERFDARYAVLTVREGKRVHAQIACLDPAPHLRESTRKLRGSVFFSATMTPLSAFRDAIGGTEADGLLSLPSPFPEENLLVMRRALSTKYRAREHTAGAVAEAILALITVRPGNYLACFPSYAYLKHVREEIEKRISGESLSWRDPEGIAPAEQSTPGITLHIQRGGMDDAARAEFLAAFVPRETGAMLGMVVMGGIFGEGVDLPGDMLSGAIIVGVGLPQIGPEREMLRAYYDEAGMDGFAHAYRYPGLAKVLQAVGRVIRTETDMGVALLIDSRFFSPEYEALLPPWWGKMTEARDAAAIRQMAENFWRRGI